MNILLIIILSIFFYFLLFRTSKSTFLEKGQMECPPHKWESIDNFKLKDGSLYSGLYCKNCKSVPKLNTRF